MQIKDFASIVASMINWMRASQDRITDFEVGSVARTILEAPAAEIDELYQQMFAGIREAIPVAVYRTFGFDPLEAQRATGIVRVTIASQSNPVLIASGTLFKTQDGRTYIATGNVTIPALATEADVPVVADTAGAAGNTGPNTTLTPAPEPLGFQSAISIAGITGGMDGETEEARRSRFAEYVQSLQRGTHRALRYAATLADVRDANGAIIERVTSAAIVEPYLVDPIIHTPGLVWLYIENRVGTPSSALINRCQQIIDGYTDANGNEVPGWKAAGVKVVVQAATRTAVNVTATVTTRPGVDSQAVITAARDIITAHLRDLPIGQPLLRSALIAAVMGLDGVSNIILTEPAADVTPAATEKLAPGTITVS